MKNWTVADSSIKSVTFKLKFENIESVSRSGTTDVLLIRIKKESIIIS
jgi:hypothetical protein